MPDSMYPTFDEAKAPAKPDSVPQKEGDEANEEGESTLVPKSMLGDKKPGDTCRFRVIRAFDGEYELEYIDSEDSSDKGDQSKPSYTDEIQSMNKE